jgi:hypothetical protein
MTDQQRSCNPRSASSGPSTSERGTVSPPAYFQLTETGLREAGLIPEADRLAAAVRRAQAWRRGRVRESAIALGLFGSKEYDRLVEIVARALLKDGER